MSGSFCTGGVWAGSGSFCGRGGRTGSGSFCAGGWEVGLELAEAVEFVEGLAADAIGGGGGSVRGGRFRGRCRRRRGGGRIVGRGDRRVSQRCSDSVSRVVDLGLGEESARIERASEGVGRGCGGIGERWAAEVVRLEEWIGVCVVESEGEDAVPEVGAGGWGCR